MTKTIMVAIEKIKPDLNQPRKNFDERRMKSLKVEKQKDGSFLLIDGERRFRAASELKLKEVPVVVLEPISSTDKLIKQYTIQSQHEGWTGLENAIALSTIKEETDLSIPEMTNLLGIPDRTLRQYLAISHLINKKEIARYNIDPHKIESTVNLLNHFNKVSKRHGIEFTFDLRKKIETIILDKIKEGIITEGYDFTKIRDSMTKDPKKTIDYILNHKKATPQEIFEKTSAKIAQDYRRVVTISAYIKKNFEDIMKDGSMKPEESEINIFKRLRETLTKFIDMVE